MRFPRLVTFGHFVKSAVAPRVLVIDVPAQIGLITTDRQNTFLLLELIVTQKLYCRSKETGKS
jgi:hypothetical protein